MDPQVFVPSSRIQQNSENSIRRAHVQSSLQTSSDTGVGVATTALDVDDGFALVLGGLGKGIPKMGGNQGMRLKGNPRVRAATPVVVVVAGSSSPQENVVTTMSMPLAEIVLLDATAPFWHAEGKSVSRAGHSPVSTTSHCLWGAHELTSDHTRRAGGEGGESEEASEGLHGGGLVRGHERRG